MTSLLPTGSLRELTSLSEVLSKIGRPAPKPKASAPKKVVLSDEQRIALRTLPTQLAALDLPDQPRALTEAERTQFIEIFVGIKDAKKAIDAAEEALKESFHNHLDAESPRNAELDKHGHKLTEGEVASDELAKVVRRQLSGGKAASLAEDDIFKLQQDGHINHVTYLEMTRQVRVVDEAAIMGLLNERPELLDVLQLVAKLTPKTSSLYVRDRA